eukprot:TRINITY_DN13049_c0_g1_i1.p1 TRINITY_DN13049_c0_g1~~TRINITY_DN13049_c0_g1_i1.p1  ORF type:complete len:369 (+),score=41.40 TRINITY_DN13049_c0_g1_i1:22-1107(+)
MYSDRPDMAYDERPRTERGNRSAPYIPPARRAPRNDTREILPAATDQPGPVRRPLLRKDSQQAKQLRHELLGLNFFRCLADEGLRRLAYLVENELHHFLGHPDANDDEQTYHLRFPFMAPRHRMVLSRVARRFHMDCLSYGDDLRFAVAYRRPFVCQAPALQLVDFIPGLGYVSPTELAPPVPVVQYRKKRSFGRQTRVEEYEKELEGEPVSLRGDFSPYAISVPPDDEEERGYDCTIANCHEHILELQLNADSAPVVTRELLDKYGVLNCRPLTGGLLAVFPTPDALRAFLASAGRKEPPEGQPDAKTDRAGAVDGTTEIQIAVDGNPPVLATARVLSWHQTRPSTNPGGANRLFSALLR